MHVEQLDRLAAVARLGDDLELGPEPRQRARAGARAAAARRRRSARSVRHGRRSWRVRDLRRRHAKRSRRRTPCGARSCSSQRARRRRSSAAGARAGWPGRCRSRRGRAQADAGVERPRRGCAVAVAARADLDAAAVLARIDAVAHRVLDQRQQRHRRKGAAAERRDRHRPRSAAGPACASASARGRRAPASSSRAERRAAAVQARHRGAQVGDQAAQHRPGLRRARLDQLAARSPAC